MSDIEQKLDTEILKEPDQYLDPIYRTHWRTSNFGRCYRMQWWYRKGVEMTNPIDLKVLKIFRVGNLFHADLQGLLNPATVEVEFDGGDVLGHADRVEDDYVEDFKTIGNFQWKLLLKCKDIEKDKEAYIYQLMAYCYFFKKPRGILTFIHKDTYEMKSFEFLFADWEGRVMVELETLRRYWDSEVLPPAVPRAYGLKDCSYCSFQKECDITEGNTAKDREKNARPQRQSIF